MHAKAQCTLPYSGSTESACSTGQPRPVESFIVCCLSRASALVSMLRHSAAPTEAYPTMAAVEALAAVVCEPGARTTDPILRHALLSETGALGRPLFALFNHPASALLRLFCIAPDMIESLLVA